MRQDVGPSRGTFEARPGASLALGDLGTRRVQGQDWALMDPGCICHALPGFHVQNGLWGSEGNASVGWGCLGRCLWRGQRQERRESTSDIQVRRSVSGSGCLRWRGESKFIGESESSLSDTGDPRVTSRWERGRAPHLRAPRLPFLLCPGHSDQW